MRILSDVEGSSRLEVGAVGQLELDKLRPKSHQGKVKVLHGGNPGDGGGVDGSVQVSSLQERLENLQVTMLDVMIKYGNLKKLEVNVDN